MKARRLGRCTAPRFARQGGQEHHCGGQMDATNRPAGTSKLTLIDHDPHADWTCATRTRFPPIDGMRYLTPRTPTRGQLPD